MFGERFFDAYRDYYQTYAATGATTETFLAFLDDHLGQESKNETDAWFRSCGYLDLIRKSETFDDLLNMKLVD